MSQPIYSTIAFGGGWSLREQGAEVELTAFYTSAGWTRALVEIVVDLLNGAVEEETPVVRPESDLRKQFDAACQSVRRKLEDQKANLAGDKAPVAYDVGVQRALGWALDEYTFPPYPFDERWIEKDDL